jgi:SAM-dependent methyltransferase
MTRTDESGGEAVTSELWGQKAREKAEGDEWRYRYWQAHPVTVRHINRLITGDENDGWLAFAKRRFLPEGAERSLSLGCGHGWTEREAIQLGLAKRFDAVDISEEAIEVAARVAQDEGLDDRIRYWQADLNTIELEPGAYGVVVAAMVLHHVERLEHLLDQISAALAPGGLFLVNEYIGPARFQWLDKTEALMNRVLDALPEELRVNPLNGLVKEHIERAPADEIAKVDPSESIRSDEIVELLASRFDTVYRADYGGTLLQFLLADIAANFSEDAPRDVALLDLMCLYEDTLIEERVLPSDFAFFVLRARARGA